MKLDICLRQKKDIEIYHVHIEEDVSNPAKESGLYYPLYRPADKGWNKAKDLIQPLVSGIDKLESYPDYYKNLNNSDVGKYTGLLKASKQLLEFCRDNPEARIEVNVRS